MTGIRFSDMTGLFVRLSACCSVVVDVIGSSALGTIEGLSVMTLLSITSEEYSPTPLDRSRDCNGDSPPDEAGTAGDNNISSVIGVAI